jgi:hypothetical protein
MKRFGPLFLILMVILAPYVNGQRCLKTPQDRLVGHWLMRPGGVHYYFSSVNESDLMGILMIYFPPNYGDKKIAGTVKTVKYSIFSQEPDGEKIKIKIDPENVWTNEKASQNVLYVIERNGKNMKTGFYDVPNIGDAIKRDFSFAYVDTQVSRDI